MLSAGHPDRRLEAATVGRGRAKQHRVTLARLPALGAEAARTTLEDLISLYDAGMRSPLPIYSATSAAYAEAAARGGEGYEAAKEEWESQRFDREDRDPEHALDALLEPGVDVEDHLRVGVPDLAQRQRGAIVVE